MAAPGRRRGAALALVVHARRHHQLVGRAPQRPLAIYRARTVLERARKGDIAGAQRCRAKLLCRFALSEVKTYGGTPSGGSWVRAAEPIWAGARVNSTSASASAARVGRSRRFRPIRLDALVLAASGWGVIGPPSQLLLAAEPTGGRRGARWGRLRLVGVKRNRRFCRKLQLLRSPLWRGKRMLRRVAPGPSQTRPWRWHRTRA